MYRNLVSHKIAPVVALALALAVGGVDTRQLRAAEAPNAIFVMRVDGSELKRVGEVPGYTRHGSPRWSHDGKRLAFDARAEPDSADKFYAVNRDGSGLKELGEGATPDWSPDDKQVAYFCRSKSLKWGAWVQNVDGKGRDWLSTGFAPRWSPDGSQLAYINDADLLAIDLVEGSQVRLLGERFTNIAPGFDWSPDGQRLAFVGDLAGKRQLWIAHTAADKGMQVRLAGDLEGYVAWSPDGKRLALSLNGLIQILDADGGQAPHQVAAVHSRRLALELRLR